MFELTVAFRLSHSTIIMTPTTCKVFYFLEDKEIAAAAAGGLGRKKSRCFLCLKNENKLGVTVTRQIQLLGSVTIKEGHKLVTTR